MYRSTVPVHAVTSDGHTFDQVDFARIVPMPSCEDVECEGCAGCELSWWTPRTAALLHGVCETELDTWLDLTGLRHWTDDAPAGQSTGQDVDQDVNRIDLEDLLEELPPVVRSVADPAWAARFVGCLTDLLHRIEDGQPPLPRCTGEEMALHMALDAAQGRIDDYGIEDVEVDEHGHEIDLELPLHWFAQVQNELPRTPGDYDINLLREVLFEDHDVLMLFDAQLDGIESDETMIAAMGLANLHPRGWFVPFRSDLGVPGLEAGFERDPERDLERDQERDEEAGGGDSATPEADGADDGAAFDEQAYLDEVETDLRRGATVYTWVDTVAEADRLRSMVRRRMRAAGVKFHSQAKSRPDAAGSPGVEIQMTAPEVAAALQGFYQAGGRD